MHMHPLDVAAHRLGSHRHRAVEPSADLDRAVPGEVGGKAGRDLKCKADFARAHSRVEIVVARQRGRFVEIARSGKVVDIGLAENSLIEVEHREFQVLNIHGDAVTQHDHEDHAADTGQR